MTASVPTKEPTVFTVGDTLTFTRCFADYPPATWTLTYALVSASAQITFSGSDNGDGCHLIDVAPATTATWTAGTYRWQATVSDGTDRHTVGRGSLTLRANYAAETTGYDGRGTWKTILDQLEAAYAAMSAGQLVVAQVSIGGRLTTYRKIEDLITAINHARLQANREEQALKLAEGLNSGNKVLVRF